METVLLAILGPVESGLVAAFGLFRHDEVAIGLSLLMILAGLALMVRFWMIRYRPAMTALKHAIADVEASEDARHLRQNFQGLDEVLSGNQLLGAGWQQFKSSLIDPRENTDAPLFYTAHPSRFLNLATAESAGLRIRMQQALPNFFVGFGLLFTFLGLVAALYFANQGVASPDIAKAQEALRDLLHAATFKFMTSVAGLAMSLALSITNKIMIQRVQGGFGRLCQSLEDRLAFISAESIAYTQYQETARQGASLEAFHQSWRHKVEQALAEAQAPLAQTIRELGENLKDMNKDALAQMAQQFIDALSQTAAKELNAIANTLGQLNSDLDRLSHRLSDTGENFGTRLEGVSGSLETSLDRATTRFQGSVDQASSQLVDRSRHAAEALASQMAHASTRWDETVAATAQDFCGTLQDASRDAAERLTTSSDHLGSRLETAGQDAAQALISSARETSETLTRTGTTLSGTLESTAGGMAKTLVNASQTARDSLTVGARDMADGLGHAGGALRSEAEEAARSVSSALQEGSARFAGDLDRAAGDIKAPLDVLTARWETLDQAFVAMDARLGTHLEAFEHTVAGLDAALSAIHEAANGFRKAAKPVTSLSQSFLETQQAEARIHGEALEMVERVEIGLATAEAAWEAYRERFELTSKEAAARLVAMAEAARRAEENQANTLGQVTGSFDGAIERLEAALVTYEARNEERLDGLSEMMKSLTKALKAATRAWNPMLSGKDDS